jgi:hypothetical protein
MKRQVLPFLPQTYYPVLPHSLTMTDIKFYRKKNGENRYVLHLGETDYILSEETIVSIKQDIEKALKIGETAKEG